MTTVYFVRHAQPDPSGGYNPDFPLTEQGFADAEIVTGVLIDKDITAAYASTYIRTAQTIRDFADKAGLEIILEDGLHERKAGKWQELDESYFHFISRQLDDYSLKAPGGESMSEVRDRCMEVMERLIKKHDGEAIAVATHGMALSSILKYFYPNYGLKEFLQIVNLMPLVLRIDLEDMKAVSSGLELAIKRIYPNSYI